MSVGQSPAFTFEAAGNSILNTTEAMPVGFIAFASIAAGTWFFSYRRRLFLRIFATKEDLRAVMRNLPRDPQFGQSMRAMALLQFAIAAIFGLVALWLRFRK
jgi:hypothetical protein